MKHMTKLNRTRWASQLALITGLSLLFLVALLWGLQDIAPARADPGTLHVDSESGQDIPTCGTTIVPCQTISHTLNSRASDGDTIRVAQGAYTENLSIRISVTLEGGYESASWTRSITQYETIVDGSGVINEPVVTIQDGGDGTVLDGLTITGGSGEEAGGVEADRGEIAIRSCLIQSNVADGSPDHSGGGGVKGNDLTIVDSRIINNQVQSGASGVRVGEGHLAMVNTIVADNLGDEGLHLNGSASLMNVTIAGNAPGTGRPGINYNPQTGGMMEVVNSIIYGNGTGDAFHVDDPGTIQVSYSDIEGGWTGTGNIDTNAWFVDPANGNYHLLPWSPCIDSGTADGAPDHDFEDDLRPQNAAFDMGADEFTGTPMPSEGPRYVATNGYDDANLCLDSGTPCRTIAHAAEMANAGEAVLVAQGTYTENLSISRPVTLTGGYEAVSWTRDLMQYDTIIDGSGSQTVVGDWDGGVSHPRVISESGQYQMWYNGWSPTNPGSGWALGFAESQDGLSWTKHGDNPILEPGADGAWDDMYRGQVAVMKDGWAYKMWYSGSDGGPWQTGYATSTNGTDWNTYTGNPVLPVGDSGSWDEQEANGPIVIKDGGIYRMWYHGCDPDYTVCSIGYATSTSGLEWSKYAGNPVLTGTEGEWDEGSIVWPSVAKDDGAYKLWYYSDGKIGLATSPDGVNWTKEAANPVLTEGWDGAGIWAHTVIPEAGTYRMWLRSGTDNSRGIGYAESADGITWTMSISNPVLTPGTATERGDPVVRLEDGSDGAVLDGFTITGGDAFAGGGLLITNNGSALVSNCTITGNQSSEGWGGGIWVTNADATIRDSLIAANQGGGIDVNPDHGPAHLALEDSRLVNNQNGGMIVNGVSADLTNVLVAGNTGGGLSAIDGGVVTIQDSKFSGNDGAIRNSGILTITGSTIEDHSGADWTIWSDDHLVMDGCTIRGNGTWGIVHIRTGQAAIRNTKVVDNDNAASNGDIIGIGGEPDTTPVVEIANVLVAGNNSARPTMNGSSPNGSITLMNVTVAANRSPNFPILAGNGTWTVTNTIVWGNTTPGDMLGLGTFSVSYSDIEGGWEGSGNIDADPKFVDPSGGDYRLGVGSPCTDKGTLAGAPAADIEGTPRDAAPDMGAYEWTGFRIFMPLTVRNFGS